MLQVPRSVSPEPDISQVRANSLNPQHDRIIAEIILCHRKTRSPPARIVGRKFRMPHLLAVAFDTPFGTINLRPLFREAGAVRRIKFSSVQVSRLLLANLSLGNENQDPERK